MALKKEKKVELVKEFSDILGNAESVVFVSFNKLLVADSNKMRRELQKEGVLYKVTKKTLLKRALDTRGITGTMPELEGEIAIATGTDLIAPARGVYSFQKDHKDNLSIVGGIFEGRYMSASEMMSIATIPPLQVLYAQFVNLINTPIQQFAVAIDQIAKSKETN